MTGLKSMQAWRSHNRCPSLFEGQGYFYFGWYFLPSETDSQSEATLNWCFSQQAYAGRDVTSLDGHLVRRPGRYSQFSGPTAMTIMRTSKVRQVLVLFETITSTICTKCFHLFFHLVLSWIVWLIDDDQFLEYLNRKLTSRKQIIE